MRAPFVFGDDTTDFRALLAGPACGPSVSAPTCAWFGFHRVEAFMRCRWVDSQLESRIPQASDAAHDALLESWSPRCRPYVNEEEVALPSRAMLPWPIREHGLVAAALSAAQVVAEPAATSNL